MRGGRMRGGSRGGGRWSGGWRRGGCSTRELFGGFSAALHEPSGDHFGGDPEHGSQVTTRYVGGVAALLESGL